MHGCSHQVEKKGLAVLPVEILFRRTGQTYTATSISALTLGTPPSSTGGSGSGHPGSEAPVGIRCCEGRPTTGLTLLIRHSTRVKWFLHLLHPYTLRPCRYVRYVLPMMMTMDEEERVASRRFAPFRGFDGRSDPVGSSPSRVG